MTQIEWEMTLRQGGVPGREKKKTAYMSIIGNYLIEFGSN